MKKFVDPELEIMEVKFQDIITTSTETIPGGKPGDPDMPDPGDDGFIWAD